MVKGKINKKGPGDRISRIKAKNISLQKENSELRKMIKAFPDIYFWLDRRGKIIDYITKKRSILYKEPRQFIGKTVKSLLPAETAVRIDPGNSELNVNLANAFMSKGDHKQSLKYLEAALWNDPLNKEAAEGLVSLSKKGVKSFHLPEVEEIKDASGEGQVTFSSGDSSKVYQVL